jgi:hypothetical protein
VSQENVEMMEGLLAGVATFDRRAFLAALPELVAQLADPEVEWVEAPENVEGRIYRGHEGAALKAAGLAK